MQKLKEKGITLVSLVVTIIVLLLLAGVAINLTMGDDGIFYKSEKSANEYNKQEATEKVNLKITSIQMKVYSESERMPTLQEVADGFCEDNEVQYVTLKRKKTANLAKITVGEAKSIFTKLKNYPYEFEIDNTLKLASIDGVKIAEITEDDTIGSMTKEELQELVAQTTRKRRTLLWEGLADQYEKEYEFKVKNEETGERYKYTDFTDLLICYCGGAKNLRSGTMLIPTERIIGPEHEWEIDGYSQRYCVFQVYETSLYVQYISGDQKMMITAIYGIN